MEKKKILVSACLLGEPCKYSGGSNYNQDVIDLLERLNAGAVPVCPEVLGGLPTPRTPAEIQDGRVVTADGRDVTEAFVRGAQKALLAAKENGCSLAVLKERSPSCGCGEIYDGSFSGRLISGDGMTARLLRQAGIPVVGERRCKEL